MTFTPRLRDNALVALFCPPGTSSMKSKYGINVYRKVDPIALVAVSETASATIPLLSQLDPAE